MMPVLVEFSRKIKKINRYSNYQFIIAGAPARTIKDYSIYYTEDDDLSVIFSQMHFIVKNAEVAIVNSGTASLETALLGTPQVVGYKMNPFTYKIAQKIIKIKYISLSNLILNKLAFKELIQNDCNSDELIKEIQMIIEDEDYRQTMMADYRRLKELLGNGGASDKIAKLMIKLLKNE